MAHDEGLDQSKQEVPAPVPSFDSPSQPMDLGNSDAEPPNQAGDPVDHVWSPQYSPAKLAELVSVKHSSVSTAPHPAVSSSAVAQSHPQSAPTHRPDPRRSGDSQHPAKDLHSYPGDIHPSLGLAPAQEMYQHQTHRGPGQNGCLNPNLSVEHSNQTWAPVLTPSITTPVLPPPPPQLPPSEPMRDRPAPPSPPVDAVKPQHHSMPGQSVHPVGHPPPWQANQVPGRQQLPSTDYHHQQQQVGYPSVRPQNAAPGHLNDQFEQQVQCPAYSSVEDPRSRGLVLPSTQQPQDPLTDLSQHARAPSGDQCNPTELHYMHHGAPSAYGASPAHEGQANRPAQSARSTADHASVMPAAYASQNPVPYQSPERMPAASWVQQPHPYPHPPDRQDPAAHPKPEPGVAALAHATQAVGRAARRPLSDHQPQAQPQPATVLSPELAAALAAGVFGQNLSSHPSPGPLQQQSQHQLAQPEQLRGKGVTPALPPELSAALASGQLNFQLGRPAAAAAAASHPQQAETPAHQAGQVPFQPGQTANQPEQAAFRLPPPAAFQPGQAAAYQAEQAAYQPDRCTFQADPTAAYQAEQATHQSRPAAYQPELPETRHWAGEHPSVTAGPAGIVHRQPGPQVPLNGVSAASLQHNSQQGSWQHSHAAGPGAERPLQMTMNSPTLSTHRHAAASQHAWGPPVLSVNPSGLHQSAAPDPRLPPDPQYLLHGLQYAQHTSQQAQHVPHQAQHVPQQALKVPQQALNVPQDSQHVSQQAQRDPQQILLLSHQAWHVSQQAQQTPHQAQQHVPRQAQHLPHQAQHVPQQAQQVSQQAQQVHQQAQHAPQQGQHVPRQAQHIPQQPQQVLQPEHQAMHRPQHASQPSPSGGHAARLDSMLPQHAQHEPGRRDSQTPAVHAERRIRHQLPTFDYQAEQQWQARVSDEGVCSPLIVYSPCGLHHVRLRTLPLQGACHT